MYIYIYVYIYIFIHIYIYLYISIYIYICASKPYLTLGDLRLGMQLCNQPRNDSGGTPLSAKTHSGEGA